MGASFSWRGLFDLIDDNTTFVRSRPEVGLTDVRYLNTGELQGNQQIIRAGLEGAVLAGPFSFQEVLIKGSYWIKTKSDRGDLLGLRLFKP